MLQWLLILLPLAAVIGWYIGRRSQLSSVTDYNPITRDYLQGINYLLNEQADKAVELFIKMITVDADTVETHIALGNLFRRRGEVDRAIRVHQNVIARPQLAKSHRIEALLALGRDYMLAGVFDRAEKLFLEVIENGEYVNESLNYLLDIYQQEKDWEQAIITAQRLESATKKGMQCEIAHYYCELALDAHIKISSEKATRYLKRALALDKECVRASLLLAEWEINAGNYKTGMKLLKRIPDQDPTFLSEAVPLLLICEKKAKHNVLHFIFECLEKNPQIGAALLLTDHIQAMYGTEKACEFIVAQLKCNASLAGIQRFLMLQLNLVATTEKQNWELFHSFIEQLLRDNPLYKCIQCGYAGKALHWQCPSCKLWGTTKPAAGVIND